MIKNAPYRFKDFQSISFQFGEKDSLVNQYDSKTGDYQYLNKRDSLIKENAFNSPVMTCYTCTTRLPTWVFGIFHRKRGDTVKEKPVRYIIEFKYKKKPSVLFSILIMLETLNW
jgi:hypothetical protein